MKINCIQDLVDLLKKNGITTDTMAAIENIPIVHHGINSDDDTAYPVTAGVIRLYLNKETGKMIFNEYNNTWGEEWVKIKAIVIG